VVERYKHQVDHRHIQYITKHGWEKVFGGEYQPQKMYKCIDKSCWQIGSILNQNELESSYCLLVGIYMMKWR
jgi:hypothetical protein